MAMLEPVENKARRPAGFRFSLRFLMALVFIAAAILGAFVFFQKRAIQLTVGDGYTERVHVHGWKITGPIIVQAPSRPTIAFSIVECPGLKLKKHIPFVVVVQHPNPKEVLTVQSADIFNNPTKVFNSIDLSIDTNYLHVMHLFEFTTFNRKQREFSEVIEFHLDELPPNEPLKLAMDQGRVFVVKFAGSKTLVEQFAIEPFPTERVNTDDPIETANSIYDWWSRNRAATKKR